MAYERTARRRGGGWIIALPGEVRRWLRITHRSAVYWHVTRGGEAVLTTSATRKAGRPEVTRLARELAANRLEIEDIRKRDEARDRGMYAEGFAHGYLQAYERLNTPDGPSAERGRRRKLWRWAYPDAAYLTDPKQLAPRAAPSAPRMNARTRRAKRDAAAWRGAETVPGPDQFPDPSALPDPARQSTRSGAAAHVQSPDPLPSPAVFEEGGVGAGRPLPGQP